MRSRRHADGVEVVGVCYVAATEAPGGSVDDIVVRMVMTRDVSSRESVVRHAKGPDAAAKVLREWMAEMCRPR